MSEITKPMEAADLPENPLDLFRTWFEAAKQGPGMPDAMALATSSPDGRPSNRFVLLKSVDERGIVFFTNYESRKAGELEANPRAAATIFWQEQRRQVRIEGSVARLGAEESDAYFRTRDRLSQIGATVSPQSCVIEDRNTLDGAVARMDDETKGQEIPRPDHWGGYLISPDTVEFWIGRDNRLHDRFRYRKQGAGWLRERLAP